MMPTLAPAAAPLSTDVAPTPTATAAPPAWRVNFLLFAYAALLALGAFALDGRYGLNYADEGYLRYGVRAIVKAGQVPMRDFQSYDPGRYYWAAGWSLLLGDGVVTTRLAGAMFQTLAIGMALLALRRAGAGRGTLLAAGLFASLWMMERFKLYEQCVALLALYPAVRLLQQPHQRNALFAGVFVGLAAFMGRNHGFYNAVAFGGLLTLLTWKRHEWALLKLFVPFVGGIVLGYLPMLLMMGFVPGFFTAFVEGLRALAHAGATNLTLPVPWPWVAPKLPEKPLILRWHDLATGWCFVGLVAGFAASAVAIVRLSARGLREHAALVAAGVIGVPYAHYAFSRADAPHLAHSMPLLIVTLLMFPALFRLPTTRRRVFAGMACTLGLLTLLGTFTNNPVAVRGAASGGDQIDIEVGEQTVSLDPGTASTVLAVQQIAQKVMAPDENILFAPYMPVMYEVAGRFSPIYESYLLWPQDEAGQRATLRAMDDKRVNWALIRLGGLDDNPQRSLLHTHPELMNYLQRNFAPVEGSKFPLPYLLLRRNEPPGTHREPLSAVSSGKSGR